MVEVALAQPYLHVNQTALLASSAGSVSSLRPSSSGQELWNPGEAELAGVPAGLLLDSPPPVPPASRKTKFDASEKSKRTRHRNQKKATGAPKAGGKEKGKVAGKTKSSPNKAPPSTHDRITGSAYAKDLKNDDRQVYQHKELAKTVVTSF
jgi:hypothetical protein